MGTKIEESMRNTHPPSRGIISVRQRYTRNPTPPIARATESEVQNHPPTSLATPAPQNEGPITFVESVAINNTTGDLSPRR